LTTIGLQPNHDEDDANKQHRGDLHVRPKEDSIEKSDANKRQLIRNPHIRRSSSIKISTTLNPRSPFGHKNHRRVDDKLLIRRNTITQNERASTINNLDMTDKKDNLEDSIDSEIHESIAYLTQKDEKDEISQLIASPMMSHLRPGANHRYTDFPHQDEHRDNSNEPFMGRHSHHHLTANLDESFVGVMDQEEGMEDDLSRILNHEATVMEKKSVIMDNMVIKKSTSSRPKRMRGVRPIATMSNQSVILRFDPMSRQDIKEECLLDYKPATNELHVKGYRSVAELGTYYLTN
jgi:hypothetical protein